MVKCCKNEEPTGKKKTITTCLLSYIVVLILSIKNAGIQIKNQTPNKHILVVYGWSKFTRANFQEIVDTRH